MDWLKRLHTKETLSERGGSFPQEYTSHFLALKILGTNKCKLNQLNMHFSTNNDYNFELRPQWRKVWFLL